MFVYRYQSYLRFCWKLKKTSPIHNLEVYLYIYVTCDGNCILAPIIGHVGDGNFHSLIMIDPDNEQERAAAKDLAFRMAKYV